MRAHARPAPKMHAGALPACAPCQQQGRGTLVRQGAAGQVRGAGGYWSKRGTEAWGAGAAGDDARVMQGGSKERATEHASRGSANGRGTEGSKQGDGGPCGAP